MTVPSYTEDLTDIATGDEASGWVELTGTAGGESYNTGGGTPAYSDNEYPYIQGSYAVTQDCTKSGLNVASMAYSSGGITVPTDGAVFVWHNFSSPFAMNTYAVGGMQICIGSGLADFDVWYVGGRDKESYPYGGFLNHVVNPTVAVDDTAGTPTGTLDYVGSAIYYDGGPSKGEPHQCDVMRYGRGSAIFEYGEAANYCTIDGFSLQNDNQTNRWALVQKTPGGYLWQGRMQLGSASNPVDFRDSDVTIFIKWCPKVTANFNTIEVLNASSNVEMTGFNFIQLDTSTASKGRWIMTNDATVVLTTCSFSDMGTFTFDSNSIVLTTTFKRCDQIDPGGGDLSFSSVLLSSVTGGGSVGGGALYWNDAGDPDTKLNDMTISKGAGSHHAIEFGTSSAKTMNLTNMTFTDFSASNQVATSALYFPDTGSDITWTVSHSGTTGTVSYYKARAGDTVNISGSVPLTVTVYDKEDGLIESGVQTAIYLTSDRTEIMNEDTDVSGVASDSHTGATPAQCEVRCRKSSSGADKFVNYSSIQTIGSGGLTLTVTLERDPNNNTTT